MKWLITTITSTDLLCRSKSTTRINNCPVILNSSICIRKDQSNQYQSLYSDIECRFIVWMFFLYSMMTSWKSRVPGLLCDEFTGHRWIPLTQRPVTRSFNVYFDLRLNKRLRKQSWGLWFETIIMTSLYGKTLSICRTLRYGIDWHLHVLNMAYRSGGSYWGYCTGAWSFSQITTTEFKIRYP